MKSYEEAVELISVNLWRFARSIMGVEEDLHSKELAKEILKELEYPE